MYSLTQRILAPVKRISQSSLIDTLSILCYEQIFTEKQAQLMGIPEAMK